MHTLTTSDASPEPAQERASGLPRPINSPATAAATEANARIHDAADARLAAAGAKTPQSPDDPARPAPRSPHVPRRTAWAIGSLVGLLSLPALAAETRVHFVGAERELARDLATASEPMTAGRVGGATTTAWADATAVWTVVSGATGPRPPQRLAEVVGAHGVGVVRTPTGGSLVWWIHAGDVWVVRRTWDDRASPPVRLPDDAPGDVETVGASVAQLANGDLAVARLRRVYTAVSPDHPRGEWRETVTLRQYGRLGKPRGASESLSPTISSCDIATFCGRSTWGTPRLAVGASTLAVVWQHQFVNGRPNFDSGSLDIYLRVLDLASGALGPIRVVNGFEHAAMSDPWVTELPDGGFAVTWTSAPSNTPGGTRGVAEDGDGAGVGFRRLGADGQPRGPQLLVNLETAGDQHRSRVAAAPDGTVLVAWRDGASFLRGRLVGPDGQLFQEELLLNSTGTEVEAPSVAALGDGAYDVTWVRRRFDGESAAVLSLAGQRLRPEQGGERIALAATTLLETDEQGTEVRFAVSLTTPPLAAVTLPVAFAAETLEVSPTALTFGPTDWHLPREVTVRGRDDGEIAGDRPAKVSLGPASSADAGYSGAVSAGLRVVVREPSCRLEVLQPAADTLATVGRRLRVVWRVSGEACGSQQELGLLRTGEPVASFGSGMTDAGFGTREVLLPADAATGGGYQIAVATFGEPAWRGRSAPFVLREAVCQIDLLSPDGGERWRRGSSHQIRWSTRGGGCGPRFEIALLRGGSEVAILASDAADGAYTWTIPLDQPRAADYRVRVRSAARPQATATSQGPFSIVAPLPRGAPATASEQAP
jgi:hypothetical protein